MLSTQSMFISLRSTFFLFAICVHTSLSVSSPTAGKQRRPLEAIPSFSRKVRPSAVSFKPKGSKFWRMVPQLSASLLSQQLKLQQPLSANFRESHHGADSTTGKRVQVRGRVLGRVLAGRGIEPHRKSYDAQRSAKLKTRAMMLADSAATQDFIKSAFSIATFAPQP
mmetsp:Transcript_12740/g.17630  ORF Transcript_12740/g.17630 Transcript_12740/m.17630 type:complete len:167 (+) Transcript_12740:75-575(+)